MTNLPDIIQKLAVTLIAFAVVATVLFLATYSVINNPDGENTGVLVQAVVTIGFAGIFAYFFTRDKQE